MSVTALLPERVDGPDGLLLRRWQLRDADILTAAVAESIEHLRPWTGWVEREPMTDKANLAGAAVPTAT